MLPALIVSFALPDRTARADQQRDPELKDLLQKIIGSADCFTDKYESVVWYKSMEPRLAQFVPTHEERIEFSTTCTAKRSGIHLTDPAGSGAGTDGGGKSIRSLGRLARRRGRPHAGNAFLAARIRRSEPTGKSCAQHPHGLRDLALLPARRASQLVAALARYNGSVGHNTYPALVMQRWQRAWRF